MVIMGWPDFCGARGIKGTSIGNCAQLEEDVMHQSTEADVSAHVLDTNGMQKSVKGLLHAGAGLNVIFATNGVR